jgi:beta-lactamase class A
MRATQLIPATAAACALLTLSAAAPAVAGPAAPAAAEPAPTAERTTESTDRLLDWLAAHPRKVGLAAYRAGDRNGIGSAAGKRVPLASVRKVLIIGAYAEQVASGRLDPRQRIRLSAVERWYWPGTDGGAHPAAVAEWRATGALVGTGAAATVALDALARATIKFSDNAAADYLLVRVGTSAVRRFAQAHGMRDQDPVYPIFGEAVAWSTLPPSAWLRSSPRQRAAVAWALAVATTPAEAAALTLPDLATQGRLSDASVAGTPADWAWLMRRLRTGTGIRPASLAVVRRHLEWPLGDFPDLAARFTRLGLKDGAFIDVLNLATFVQPAGQAGTEIALFLHDLSEQDLTVVSGPTGDLPLLFALRLAQDPAFFATVRDRLGTSVAATP